MYVSPPVRSNPRHSFPSCISNPTPNLTISQERPALSLLSSPLLIFTLPLHVPLPFLFTRYCLHYIPTAVSTSPFVLHCPQIRHRHLSTLLPTPNILIRLPITFFIHPSTLNIIASSIIPNSLLKLTLLLPSSHHFSLFSLRYLSHFLFRSPSLDISPFTLNTIIIFAFLLFLSFLVSYLLFFLTYHPFFIHYPSLPLSLTRILSPSLLHHFQSHILFSPSSVATEPSSKPRTKVRSCII